VGEGDRPCWGRIPQVLSHVCEPTRTLVSRGIARAHRSSGTLDEVVALILDELERTQT